MNFSFADSTFRDSAAAAGAAHAGHRCLFLLTPSEESCAIEIFTRSLVGALRVRYPEAGYALLPVSGRLRDLPHVIRETVRADRIFFSVPLVSWKRMLITPILILLAARLARRPVSVFMHEWSGLHWMRRVALAPIVLLSQVVFVVSPFIADQIARNRWLFGAGARCHLVPHPPTICPAPDRLVTERVERLREAAAQCDVVIGCFGSIYRSKAATALLGLCEHLRGRGVRALVVFIGNFTQSLDGYQQEFWSKVRELGIEDRVVVTGYVQSEAELYALFDEIGAFLFLFPEGLTARRSSVIACLHSSRPVLVTAPRSATEFAHHKGFSELIADGALSFVPEGASLPEIADQLLAVARQPDRAGPVMDTAAWWDATMEAVRAGSG
jgi:glycosyltransferase involved in cell wall biosynthesis